MYAAHDVYMPGEAQASESRRERRARGSMALLPREGNERISKARWAGWGGSAMCGKPNMAHYASEGEETSKGSDESAVYRGQMV